MFILHIEQNTASERRRHTVEMYASAVWTADGLP